MMQAAVVSGIALVMTIGVYGLVAGIVKLDDLGYFLQKQASRIQQALGRAILSFAPWLMKALSVIGTAAMFLVGGGILLHGIPGLENYLHHLRDGVITWPYVGGVLGILFFSLAGAVLGIVAGAIILAVVQCLPTPSRAQGGSC